MANVTLKTKAMKRAGNLYENVCSLDNLNLADSRARKGKMNQPAIKKHDENREDNINALHCMLINKSYKTSAYNVFKIKDPKERDIYRLPYYPDRIVHHAIMNVLENIFVSTFTADTYSCIKGKGVHAAVESVKRSLKNVDNTVYCMQLDAKKFYPSIDHDILKTLLRKKIKDNDLLWLLDEIIDSADGLPIGNYLSQYLANFYLTYFDHWIKEQKRVKHYFRYADDLIILSADKTELHVLLSEIKEYMSNRLNLTIKDNYQIFPVRARGIDFVGYRFFHTHTLVRKRIKRKFARMMANKTRNRASVASYLGWLTHADCRHLTKKLLRERF